MKHLWTDAPAWASHLAMNQNGEWWWFEFEPEKGCTLWFIRQGRSQLALINNTAWTHSCSPRPV